MTTIVSHPVVGGKQHRPTVELDWRSPMPKALQRPNLSRRNNRQNARKTATTIRPRWCGPTNTLGDLGRRSEIRIDPELGPRGFDAARARPVANTRHRPCSVPAACRVPLPASIQRIGRGAWLGIGSLVASMGDLRIEPTQVDGAGAGRLVVRWGGGFRFLSLDLARALGIALRR